MSYDTQIGKYYLLLRKKSLKLGLSKSITIPYVVRHIGEMASKHGDIPTIIDFGCSEGDILNEINSLLQDKVMSLIGLDYNKNIIKKAQKNYPEVEFINHDITTNSLAKFKGNADVALCINTLHEVFSFHSFNGKFKPESGIQAIRETIKNISSTLKPGGIFVMFDGVESYLDLNRKITIELKSTAVEKSLKMFKEEYGPYKIHFKKIRPLVYELDLLSFTRFITKYRFLNSLAWSLEKEESYQYFNKLEFVELFQENDFRIEAMNLLSPNRGIWSDYVNILDSDITFPYEHVLLVGKKRQT